MKLRVARARPSEVLDGPALVAFVVAELATRAEVLVRLATVEVETAEFPADAKMLRGAPALADVVRFEVATDALVRNGTTIAATDVARALVRRGPALVAAELPESGAHASVSRGVAVAHVRSLHVEQKINVSYLNSGLKCVPVCLSLGVLNWSVGPGASIRQSIIAHESQRERRHRRCSLLSPSPCSRVSSGALAKA